MHESQRIAGMLNGTLLNKCLREAYGKRNCFIEWRVPQGKLIQEGRSAAVDSDQE